uniref:Uncharacterized protein n=1 Tax=Anguilla anguilla TaxID=7936 RepID=A0A0E9VG78_ANGAN
MFCQGIETIEMINISVSFTLRRQYFTKKTVNRRDISKAGYQNCVYSFKTSLIRDWIKVCVYCLSL